MDPTTARNLHALGIDHACTEALWMLPLVEVAWADGHVDSRELEQIRGAAKRWAPSKEASLLVDGWVRVPPSNGTVQLGLEAAAALTHRAPIAEVLAAAEAVADASGGLLGFRRRSAPERAVLARWAAALQGEAPHREATLHQDMERREAPVNVDFLDRGDLGASTPPASLTPDFERGLRFDVPGHGYVRVGSDPEVDVPIEGTQDVAPVHCHIEARDGEWTLLSLHPNTYVNGQRVVRRRLLGGEVIRLGATTTFVFQRLRWVPSDLAA